MVTSLAVPTCPCCGGHLRLELAGGADVWYPPLALEPVVIWHHDAAVPMLVCDPCSALDGGRYTQMPDRWEISA